MHTRSQSVSVLTVEALRGLVLRTCGHASMPSLCGTVSVERLRVYCYKRSVVRYVSQLFQFSWEMCGVFDE